MREPVAAARAEGRDSRAEDKESVLAAILATVANDADIEIPFVDLEPSDDENDDNADAAGGSAQDRGKAEAARAQQDWTRSLAMLADIPLHNHTERQLYLRPNLVSEIMAMRLDNTVPISRFDARDGSMTAAHFRKHCSDRPWMITGIPQHYNWPAATTWNTREKFLERHGNVPCKVAEVAPLHGMGKPLVIRLPLAMYAEYSDTCQADFPCYTFERDFSDVNDALLQDWTVPEYFTDDVFALTPELRMAFPQYRYLVVGGSRTGSNMHVDPMYSAAWNTLLCGRKKWILVPPLPLSATPEDNRALLAAMGLPDDYSKMGRPPLYWWLDAYPKLQEHVERLGAIEVIQEPGETIYVPQGWWHCVLNEGFTVAATQNFLSTEDLARVWPRIARQAPMLASLLTEAGVAPSDDEEQSQ